MLRVFDLVLFIIATVTNLTTLTHVAKSFELKVHISCLIFIDAVISTTCSVLSSINAVISIVAADNPVLCTVQFISNLIPCYLGACLTFLMASIRLRDRCNKTCLPSLNKLQGFGTCELRHVKVFAQDNDHIYI